MAPVRVLFAATRMCLTKPLTPITPLGDFVGHEILTVDGLGEEGLHPVQSAMVSEHGSQCGFCTPGFVMALAARSTRIILKGINGSLG